jgi:hypothetical protein
MPFCAEFPRAGQVRRTKEFAMSRLTLAVLLASSLLAVVPAQAQETTPADLGGFNEACAGAQQFLLGEVPAGVDPTSILTPLCACLDTGFKDLPQKDVDILATDLRGEGTEEAHAAHGGYDAVEGKAREVLNTCYASPEVQAVMVTPEAAGAPAEATPAPAEPAPAPAQ